MRQGKFRQDLYFRLNVVQIKMPPLRERKSDIPILVNSFLEKFSEANGKTRTISEDAITRLMAYDWPGNVRELENAIERAVALGSGPILHAGDLPTNLQYGTGDKLPRMMSFCRSRNSNAVRFSVLCARPAVTSSLPHAAGNRKDHVCIAS